MMTSVRTARDLATSVAQQALAIATAEKIDTTAVASLLDATAELAVLADALAPITRTVNERITEFIDHLNAHPKSRSELTDSNGKVWYRHKYHADKPGVKYTRVVTTIEQRTDAGNWVNGQRAVHCFVENATGLVYKSAGWATPAKGSRFNLMDDTSRADLFARSSFSGGEFYR